MEFDTHVDSHTPSCTRFSLPSHHRVTVRLSNTQDPGRERLSLIRPNFIGMIPIMSDLRIDFTGDLPASAYTSVVSTLAYQHLAFIPEAAGNPTTNAIR